MKTCSICGFHLTDNDASYHNCVKRFRHYCRKCGLTWFDAKEKAKCPDCNVVKGTASISPR